MPLAQAHRTASTIYMGGERRREAENPPLLPATGWKVQSGRESFDLAAGARIVLHHSFACAWIFSGT